MQQYINNFSSNMLVVFDLTPFIIAPLKITTEKFRPLCAQINAYDFIVVNKGSLRW